MRVHPTIAALRSNRAPQRHAQAAMKSACDNWCAEKDVAVMLKEFERIGQGTALEECPALEEVFSAPDSAERLIDGLVEHFCTALAENPLGHPPFRNGAGGGACTMLLAKSGRAQLHLQAREPGEYTHSSATFSHAIRFDATLAGEAEAEIMRIHGPREKVSFSGESIKLNAGVRLAFDCSSEMLQVCKVTRRLVTLRLVQNAAKPEAGREYCSKTGKLLMQSSGSLVNSRRENMVALLGRMKRPEAALTMAKIALGPDDESLRWQSLRECIALDSAIGFHTLCWMASDPEDALSANAGALRAQLVEAHPQLLTMESA